MAAEPPNANWHPALMPDHESPPPPADSIEQQQPPRQHTPISSPDSLHNGTPLNEEPEPHSLDFANGPDDHPDTWLPSKDDVDEGGAWLASTAHPGFQHADPTGISKTDAAMSAQTEEPSKPTGAKHGSSMSFARTVSHEISFGDDDESEWSLPRTNTDPFKFMPPSDRTNSFPVVPPMASAQHTDEHPLQPNQALDVLEDTEKDWGLHARPGEEGSSHEIDDTYTADAVNDSLHARHETSLSMGGDVAFEPSPADARYEEGIPLVSHQQEQDQQASEQSQKGVPALFTEDKTPEDDGFFSHLNGNAQDAPSNGIASEPAPTQTTDGTADTSANLKPSRGHRRTKTKDLNAKWQEAFMDDDDDDFLLDDEAGDGENVDPTAFLGSDDEGLLDEAEDAVSAEQPTTAPYQPAPAQLSKSSPYASQNAYQQTPSAYQPVHPAVTTTQGFYNPVATTNHSPLAPPYVRSPLAGNEPPKAQSFVDKSKGGYSSPFDLPADLVGSVPKPRKRPSTQSLYSPVLSPNSAPPPPPPAGTGAPGPPPMGSRPSSSHARDGPPPANQKPSVPPLRNKSSFFEELPMASRPKPASRHASRVSSPALNPSQILPPPPAATSMGPVPPLAPPTAHTEPPVQPVVSAGLVAPEKVSPYAALQSGISPVPPSSNTASRYSPAPPLTPGQAAPVPPAGNRYSPVPPAPRATSYSPSRAATTTPPILPHQPRTSSPLAHFEITSAKPHHGELGFPERRSSSSSYDPRTNRVSSLPPTREVDEEEDDDRSGAGVLIGTRHSSAEYRYSPVPAAARHTPPPPAQAGQAFSPPKRAMSNYLPQAPPVVSQPGIAPPPRPQTQSPTYTRVPKPDMHGQRPSSAHSPKSSNPGQTTQPSAYMNHSRARGASLTMSMVAPTDGREQDPLQRWKGAPIIAWGVGGIVATTFPKSIPRYTMGSSTPTISRTPGEVRMQSIKDVLPLTERVSKFPGPLKGKSKKKETIAWLTSGIEEQEKDIGHFALQPGLSLEAKRSVERLLLWKILRVFVENDGALEGNPAVVKSVADILSSGSETAEPEPAFLGQAHLAAVAPMTSTQSDAVDPGAVESIRVSLMNGDREAAVWAAADKRMWGHAMLIANTVSPSLYQQVAQEFVRKEVNYAGHSNEPMAALYKILSGNYDDCVDELVPSHARAGFQLVSTDPSTGLNGDAMSGLDKWRQTLALVLRNRSTNDERGLNALGNLLAGYGRAEAAHICFLFSRSVSVFSGLDDPTANFVLVGSDHRGQAAQLGKDAESLLLSEVYEYGLTLSGGVATASGAHHLAGYKLHHALTLCEHGQRDKALQYCEAITTAMSSQTKRSPYYNAFLAASLDNVMTRLKQAPKDDSGSWISKPSMNKVSDSMWNKFNKFVSGDDEGPDGANSGANGDASPFNHIGSPTTLSPSPSTHNFDIYGAGAAARSYTPGVVAPSSATSSKYAPIATSSLQSSPAKYASAGAPTADQPSPSHYPGFPGAATSAPPDVGSANPYASISGYQPLEASPSTSRPGPSPYQALQPSASLTSLPLTPGQQQQQQQQQRSQSFTPASFTPASFTPSALGYEPPQMTLEPATATEGDSGSPGFEPPSLQPYGYEPPSYEPPSYNDEEPTGEDGDEPRTRKKSFMDDDEDDIPAPRAQEKTKSDKDRENEEMFRKAAEEDAKRAEEEKASKKGWGLGSWFSKKPPTPKPAENPNKPVRANLGEASSFVYDPDLKRWINKKPGAEKSETKTATPPPPRAGRPPAGTPPPPGRSVSGGPPPRSLAAPPQLNTAASYDSLRGAMGPPPPVLSRSYSNTSLAGGPPSGPPSRPGTSMSNASSIDDLLGAPSLAPRKAGAKKPRKSGRYVDVMATK